MKMPEIVKCTKDYIIVKVYFPKEHAAAKRKGNAGRTKPERQSYKNRRKE